MPKRGACYRLNQAGAYMCVWLRGAREVQRKRTIEGNHLTPKTPGRAVFYQCAEAFVGKRKEHAQYGFNVLVSSCSVILGDCPQLSQAGLCLSRSIRSVVAELMALY